MGLEDNSRGNITIIDMSLLPYEILENVTGLIGRLILEFLQRIQKVPEADYVRGELPILMVLEEAQNYIPERNKDIDRVSISKRIFERISREGRKYGLGLLLSSQRPSELSKTILSQCNSFVVHRLQNPDDQRYIKQIVSSSNEDLLNQLPVLPPQHAIVMGECVRSPLQVKLRNVNPKPESSNPKFVDKWISGTDINIDKVVKIWTQEEK
jgi:DNA helicase HerA-like ATPase